MRRHLIDTALAAAAAVVLGFAPVFAKAQEEAFVVRDIRIEGLQRISEGAVLNYLPVNIGDTLDAASVRQLMRGLYASGFFADVEFRRDGDALLVAVREQPTIESLLIEGNKDVKSEDLNRTLFDNGISEGSLVKPSVLEEVELSLTDLYFGRGKYGAEVNVDVTELPDNKVDVVIDITEGDRSRIRQINIVGNELFTDKELKKDFELKTPNWLSFIRQDDRYSREALQGDLEKLRSYYLDRGYADFELQSTQVTLAPDLKDVFITINLREGSNYTVSEVKLAGDFVVDEAELNQYVLLKPGMRFSQRLITQSSELIRLRLGQEGYGFAEIVPDPEIDEDAGEVAVTLWIQAERRVYVRRITFDGAPSIEDEVLRRELRQFEGAYLSNDLLERSKIRLQRLPYLEEVDFETLRVPGSQDEVDVVFSLTERQPGEFQGSVGYTGYYGMQLSGSAVHSNLFGRGNRLAIGLTGTSYSRVYNLSYTDPYATMNGVSITGGLTYQNYTQFFNAASDLDTTTASASVELSYPITEYQSVILGATLQQADLITTSFSNEQSRQWVQANGKPYEREVVSPVTGQPDIYYGSKFASLELLMGWLYDSRNRVLFPDRGMRHRLSLSATIPGSDVEYATARYQYTQYLGIPGLRRWFSLRLNADVGISEAFGDTSAVPPYKHFYGGGPDSVRGFKEYRLGPKDRFGNAYGGNMLVTGQVELILPLPERFRQSARLAAFFDVGNVFSTSDLEFFDRQGDPLSYDFDTSKLKRSVGIGAEWLAPLGLLRFSFAAPLNADSETDRFWGDEVERFQFSLGGAF
ncbi:MAG: outer membrane protein assembly factor BamA [Gammaproteobacteria bacterium]|nr:outer membrane protein assembly factor BamA [Gammaproteobacteria bacterium]MDE0455104.1 outer membrane protein assembly factor BamA [Gammaproteobacteria bacterium]